MMTPTLRLGVTGLSRSGKTVFITALIRNLVSGGRLPFFIAGGRGPHRARLSRAAAGRRACRALTTRGTWRRWARDPPRWPESTRRMSQLRVTIEFTLGERPAARLRHLAAQPRRRRLSRRVADRPAAAGNHYEHWSRGGVGAGRARRAARRTPRHGSSSSPALDPSARKDEQTALTRRQPVRRTT